MGAVDRFRLPRVMGEEHTLAYQGQWTKETELRELREEFEIGQVKARNQAVPEFGGQIGAVSEIHEQVVQ